MDRGKTAYAGLRVLGPSTKNRQHYGVSKEKSKACGLSRICSCGDLKENGPQRSGTNGQCVLEEKVWFCWNM